MHDYLSAMTVGTLKDAAKSETGHASLTQTGKGVRVSR